MRGSEKDEVKERGGSARPRPRMTPSSVRIVASFAFCTLQSVSSQRSVSTHHRPLAPEFRANTGSKSFTYSSARVSTTLKSLATVTAGALTLVLSRTNSHIPRTRLLSWCTWDCPAPEASSNKGTCLSVQSHLAVLFPRVDGNSLVVSNEITVISDSDQLQKPWSPGHC